MLPIPVEYQRLHSSLSPFLLCIFYLLTVRNLAFVTIYLLICVILVVSEFLTL